MTGGAGVPRTELCGYLLFQCSFGLTQVAELYHRDSRGQGVRYLNEVAQELGVTVYYINIDRADYNIRGDREAYDRVLSELGPVLGEEDGEKIILTPDVFQICNGEFGDNHIGLTGNWEGSDPSQASINQLKEYYRQLLTPYIR